MKCDSRWHLCESVSKLTLILILPPLSNKQTNSNFFLFSQQHFQLQCQEQGEEITLRSLFSNRWVIQIGGTHLRQTKCVCFLTFFLVILKWPKRVAPSLEIMFSFFQQQYIRGAVCLISEAEASSWEKENRSEV